MVAGGCRCCRIWEQSTEPTMKSFTCEITDTMGGEANYSWARREIITVPDNASDLTIMRRAKSALGLSGVKCRKSDYGDMIELRPIGMCQVAFITANY